MAGECAWIAVNHAMRCVLGPRFPSTHGNKIGEMNRLVARQGVLKGKYEKIGDVANELHVNSYESDLNNGELKSKTQKVINFSKAVLEPNLSF